jgi:hypothetical protein
MLACHSGAMGKAGRIRGTARAAVHAAAGVPRLFGAARGAGAGPVEATRLLMTSAVVLFVVAPRAAGVPGRQNAVRHFVWQAWLTARYGEAVARAVAKAQEHGSTQPEDSAIDGRNNAVAQAYGSAHAEELAVTSTAAALRELLRVGLAKWEAGELSGGRAAAGAAGHRRRGWRGGATPRTPS